MPALLSAESPVPMVYVTPWQDSPSIFSPPHPHFRADSLLQRGSGSVRFPMIRGPSVSGFKCNWLISFKRFKWLLRYTFPSLLQLFLRLGHPFLLKTWGRKNKEQTASAPVLPMLPGLSPPDRALSAFRTFLPISLTLHKLGRP